MIEVLFRKFQNANRPTISESLMNTSEAFPFLNFLISLLWMVFEGRGKTSAIVGNYEVALKLLNFLEISGKLSVIYYSVYEL